MLGGSLCSWYYRAPACLFVPQLYQCLLATLDPNPAARKAAEAALEAGAKQPGFGATLVQITLLQVRGSACGAWAAGEAGAVDTSIPWGELAWEGLDHSCQGVVCWVLTRRRRPMACASWRRWC